MEKKGPKQFPDNRNPDNFSTTIPKLQILITEELLLQTDYFISPSIANS